MKKTSIKIPTCPKCQGDGCNPAYSGDSKRPIKMVACDCPAGRAWHGERGHIPANDKFSRRADNAHPAAERTQ